jgi:hypothetical protein
VDVLFEGRSLPVVDRQFTDDFVEPFTVRIYRVIED